MMLKSDGLLTISLCITKISSAYINDRFRKTMKDFVIRAFFFCATFKINRPILTPLKVTCDRVLQNVRTEACRSFQKNVSTTNEQKKEDINMNNER